MKELWVYLYGPTYFITYLILCHHKETGVSFGLTVYLWSVFSLWAVFTRRTWGTLKRHHHLTKMQNVHTGFKGLEKMEHDSDVVQGKREGTTVLQGQMETTRWGLHSSSRSRWLVKV